MLRAAESQVSRADVPAGDTRTSSKISAGRSLCCANWQNSFGADGIDTDTLSMGMTADFRAAIFEGATMVRIGTALFGARDT